MRHMRKQKLLIFAFFVTDFRCSKPQCMSDTREDDGDGDIS
jgi:hypothetical protein